ncbi:hypothetical protein ABUE31_04780 [Mesorhizobium sp. ZMM04-5]|uniref:Uncharacterized protein n=1 Tax=Mesorhizobium marinum TaxID=3228790 RepID=A0ABV3QWF4_9HYPH
MSRDFTPVSPSIWSSPAFLRLDGDGRQLHLYLITGPHQNSAGCCRLREGYVLADLGWQSKQYRTALANVIAADLVMHDPATHETYVKKWFKHRGNIPTNKDHAKGTMKLISSIASDDIREVVEQDFMQTEWGARTFPVTPANDGEHPFAPSPNSGVSDALVRSKLVSGGCRI